MESIASTTQMQRLMDTGQNYDNWLAWLKSVRPRYTGTPMAAKIDAVIADGESKRSAIGTVLTTVRDAWNWLHEQGSGAIDALKSAVGLGILPAIPAVWVYGLGATAVGGALATMGYWIGSASNLKKELDIFDAAYQRAVSVGANPIDAIKVASDAVRGIVTAEAGRTTAQGDSGMGAQLVKQGGKIVLVLALAAGAYVVAKRQGWIR